MEVHNILSFIGELLKSDQTIDVIISLFLKIEEIAQHPQPNFEKQQNSQDNNPDESHNNEIKEDFYIKNNYIHYKESKIIYNTKKWLEKSVNISPILLSNIMKRLFSALSRMNDEIKTSDLFLGYLLHRQIIAFFNAVLIEESEFKGINKFSSKNAVSSDDEFIKNCQQIVRGDCPFLDWLSECPLWYFYIDPKSIFFDKLINNFIKYKPSSHKNSKELVRFDNLYDLYNSVVVIGVSGKSYSSSTGKSGNKSTVEGKSE